ncbi:hypothetical protein HZB02_02005 [Candidatus Woesearchaeota archaeon]|nr:hypothetical protein [Candidatus Woesearchaeota archaeon]
MQRLTKLKKYLKDQPTEKGEHGEKTYPKLEMLFGDNGNPTPALQSELDRIVRESEKMDIEKRQQVIHSTVRAIQELTSLGYHMVEVKGMYAQQAPYILKMGLPFFE